MNSEIQTKDRILLVEDDLDARDLLAELLRSEGSAVDEASDFSSAQRFLSEATYDLVLTDLELGDRSGLEVCDSAHKGQPGVPVIVVTGHGSLTVAIDAIRAGAYDFITKPVDAQLLGVAVRRALEHRQAQVQLKELKDCLSAAEAPGRLIGNCEAMRRVYDLIARVADTPSSVLICGESGTGKELVARALHDGSERKDRTFVGINCAAMPANLLESELFGHEKGAFTDARSARQGLFQQANGGTLFLDEIGEMPSEMQAKLLRVLQERTVRPVGATKEIPVDVRVITATNRDLEDEIEEGRFREDLYYRLNVVQINLPPLRNRGNDVLLLAHEFITKAAQSLEREVSGLSGEAGELLLAYDWPGNVRQLQNCIERAVTLARYEKITPEDLPEKVRGYVAAAPQSGIRVDPEHISPLSVIERRYIEQVLKFTKNNKSQAARLLGMDRRTLYRKLDSYEKLAASAE